MKDYFYALSNRLFSGLTDTEILTCSFQGEDSDFVRLNHNQIRQAGNVLQQHMTIDLIEGQRHAAGSCQLIGDLEQDLEQLTQLIKTLRKQRSFVPEDPHLHFATEVHSSEQIHDNSLPETGQALDQIMTAATGLDLVGVWASGVIYEGFANSLGQKNWHSSATFNFDWSCYHEKDKAVKSNYAGFEWNPARLTEKMDDARSQLKVMAKKPKTLSPGRYRVYLAPGALQDILDMMAWGGFGLKSHKTAQTPLIKMVNDGKTLHGDLSIHEEHARCFAPIFTDDGFIKPQRITLIETGVYKDCLVGPRSAKEYDAQVNSSGEYPESLELNAGRITQDEILGNIGSGLYINNLWYCNFSDRNNCQITGMTRFACFWVENGSIQTPVNVMRFDESVYRMLGEQLIGLTEQRDIIFDTGTYSQRSTRSYKIPGALVDGFTLTL